MSRLSDPDAFYQALVELHDRLDDEQGRRLDARLILLMAERIGDEAVLHALLKEACEGLRYRTPTR